MLVTVSSEDSLKFDIKHVFRLDVLFFNFFSSVFFLFQYSLQCEQSKRSFKLHQLCSSSDSTSMSSVISTLTLYKEYLLLYT